MHRSVWFTLCYWLQQQTVFDYCHIHSVRLDKSSGLRSLSAASEVSLCFKNGCPPSLQTSTFIHSVYRLNYSKRQDENIGNMHGAAK